MSTPVVCDEVCQEDQENQLAGVEKVVLTSAQQVRIKVHEQQCFPVPDNSCGFDIRVDLGSSEEAAIPPRMCFQWDCGWSVALQKGQRLEVQTDSGWAKKGLFVVPALYPAGGEFQRVKLNAFNLGKQILGPQHGEVIAKGWFSVVPQVALVSE